MDKVLIVEDDPDFLNYLNEGLQKYKSQFEVLSTPDGKKAIEMLTRETVSVLVADLVMPKIDEPELLAYMTKKHPKVACIAIAEPASPEIKQRTPQLKDVFRHLEKPLDVNELAWAIIEGLERRDEGNLAYIENIEIDGDAIGLDEAFNTDELSRRKQAFSPQNPVANELLSQGVRLAEGNHFQQAQTVLTGLLKIEPRNCKGWLWYSRVIGSMKTIESSLKNAAGISPKDPEVVEEFEKFKLAQNRMPEGRVRRCPFCWSPLKETAVECRYCRSHLVIHGQFFAASRSARRNVLEKAIQRYTQVIGREENVNAHYYLAMAHLNLKHWEEALDRLHKAEKLAPHNKVFSDQLRILLNHTAGLETAAKKEAFRPEGEPNPAAAVQAQEKRNKVLVVDDSAITRKVVSIALVQKGYEVLEAKNGMEALAKLREERPKLVLLDIIMPGIDGYKVLSIIRSDKEFKHTPVIMLTARDKLFDKIKGKMSASDEYLTKPFDPEELVAKIQKYLPDKK